MVWSGKFGIFILFYVLSFVCFLFVLPICTFNVLQIFFRSGSYFVRREAAQFSRTFVEKPFLPDHPRDTVPLRLLFPGQCLCPAAAIRWLACAASILCPGSPRPLQPPPPSWPTRPPWWLSRPPCWRLLSSTSWPLFWTAPLPGN